MGMDPMSAAIGGGSIASNVGLAVYANDQNRAMANKQMRFQAYMSDTAHQREVKDLVKAGLNPILSANSGASTGAGASANMVAPQIDLPSILQAQSLQQNQQTIDQNQQRINIEKANSAAAISKDLSQADLNKASTLVQKGGALSKYLGTSAGEAVDFLKKGAADFYRKSLIQQPPPSSGGNIYQLQP